MESVATLIRFLKVISASGITVEQLQAALETGYLGEIVRNGNLDETISGITASKYAENRELVMKLIEPEKLVVTRAMDSLRHETGEGFQMRFWKNAPGYLECKGHVDHFPPLFSELEVAVLLFEHISPKPQGEIDYPNDGPDLTNMCPEGYKWFREDVYRTDRISRERFGMHVFRMIKVL